MRHVMWCGHMIIPRNATKHKSPCKESQEYEYRGQDLCVCVRVCVGGGNVTSPLKFGNYGEFKEKTQRIATENK